MKTESAVLAVLWRGRCYPVATIIIQGVITMATQKKTIDAKEFYSEDFKRYLVELQRIKPEEDEPLILKATTTKEQALNAVEQIITGNDKELDKKFNKKVRKLIAKSNAQPTVKKVYQNVLMTFFKTQAVEYDYSYSLNDQFIDISPKRISINEGYAEFTTGTECFSGTKDDWFWEHLKQDGLSETPEEGYLFATLNQSDIDKDSKTSMTRYNEQLKRWVMDYQQEELGAARRVYKANIYDKKYSYTDAVLLAPYVLVSYDLGNMIVTFTVNAHNGKAEAMLLNDPMAKFGYDFLAPPSFSIPLFLVISVCILIMGSIFYVLNFISKKLTYNSKILHGYTLEELRKLL